MTNEIRASHILLMYEGSARSTASRTKDEARRGIEALAERVGAGEDFDALAKEVSDCPSRAKGGDLGRFGRGMMVAAFEDTVFALDVGQTSGVVETDFGYHLIRRTG